MKYITIILFSIFLLLGCGHNPPSQVVEKQVVKVISIPTSMLSTCKASEFIKTSEYITYSSDKKEEVLTLLNIKLYGDIAKCNAQLREIQDYQNKQLLLLKGPDK